MSTKVLTFRIPVEDAIKVEEAALVLGKPVSDIAREGTLEYVEKCRKASDYPAKARARAAELQRQVEKLQALASG